MCQVMLSVADACGVNSSALSICCKDALDILMHVNQGIHLSITLQGAYLVFIIKLTYKWTMNS